MSPLFKFFAFIHVVLLFAVTSQAAPYQLGEPVMTGSGCPAGTARAALSPDGSVVSIIFDDFVVKGKKGGNHYLEMRKFCRFKIPVNIMPGFALVATKIDYRGFAHVQNGNRAFIVTAGPLTNMGEFSVGEQPVKSELKKMSTDYLVTQPIPVLGQAKCSQSRTLDFNVVIQLFGPSARGPLYLLEEAMVTLDSADVIDEAPIDLQIELRPCK